MKKVKTLVMKWIAIVILMFITVCVLLVLPFKWINPPFTTVIAERWLTDQRPDFKIQQSWLAWEQMPKSMAMAVVTAEDQRFVMHSGFDLDSMTLAIEHAIKGKSLRGASTISQQVAKNLYLWTGRSWLRKALEAWFTVIIELTWSKQRILEVYLNIAEWGDGVFGAQQASYYYFSKPLAELTAYQQALLASILPSPIKYSAANPSAYLVDRAKWNLSQQKRLGGTAWLEGLED